MSVGITSESVFDFKAYAASRRTVIETALGRYLENGEPQSLWEAMRYSVMSGGKRLRALLCIAGAEAALENSTTLPSRDHIMETVLPCACAIELVHAMSLIHDDLPCLDNDDFRRGQPTNHKMFGEAMALLAGDALIVLANEILLRHTPKYVQAETLLDVALELSLASGANGMVGGQVIDMAYTGVSAKEKAVDAQTLESIHRGKTGALIRFSVWSGAKLVGASDTRLSKLAKFGEVLGLAFQIADDLLDVTGNITTLGKTPGKDQASSKATWVTLFGEDGARKRLSELEDEGQSLISAVSSNQEKVLPLQSLLSYSIHRSN